MGDSPYIFVNYSNHDREKVIPLLDAMQARGYRIWFDDGIYVGADWTETIAERIANCTVFLSFISSTSTASDWCHNELLYSFQKKKYIVPVYLENIALPASIMMFLHSVMSFRLYDGSDNESFLEAIRKSPAFDSCLDSLDFRPNVMFEESSFHNDAKTAMEPYEGSNPFIFISYNHDEIEKVLSFVRAMIYAGFRVWYDEGIHVGDNWRKAVVEKMNFCRVFFSFLSPTYLESRDCKRELIFADKRGKIIVPAYMECFVLPDEIDYMLGEYQALKLYLYKNIDDVISRLKQEPNLIDCWK